MVVGLLGNESPDLNRFILVNPKSENDVRLQATIGNQNPTGLPVGAVRKVKYCVNVTSSPYIFSTHLYGASLGSLTFFRLVVLSPYIKNAADSFFSSESVAFFTL